MAERDPRQECGCPPWRVACEHLDGYNAIAILRLPDPPPCRCYEATGVYDVLEIVGMARCPCGGSPAVKFHGGTWSRFDSLPEAQADFARRAELLRQGVADVA